MHYICVGEDAALLPLLQALPHAVVALFSKRYLIDLQMNQTRRQFQVLIITTPN
jgi:hypothetical protein